ncbi:MULTISPECIES: DUF6278 family protein [unclassified Nocardioides]|uniref:DUF6278 family protein n=1 Tax=unclassified Nocardioides TaxID=2615069 RepID=UPI000AEED87C|nr:MULTISPECIES: DUF6278 family protein [unclassified Nocardioides]
MSDPMMWVFAVLVVLAMGGVAMLAAGHGEPMVPSYDDRPDALVPAHRPVGAGDLRKVRFSLALRGYRMSEVDALLARLASEMEAGRPADAVAQPELAEPGAAVRTTAEEWALAHPAGTDILDFSTESVDQVESFLDQWSRRPDRSDAADNEDVWAAGAYVGEIIVRTVPGARWVEHPDHAPVPVVVMPSGALENPIGRARARYEGDEGDSIAAYLDATLAAERV